MPEPRNPYIASLTGCYSRQGSWTQHLEAARPLLLQRGAGLKQAPRSAQGEGRGAEYQNRGVAGAQGFQHYGHGIQLLLLLLLLLEWIQVQCKHIQPHLEQGGV